MTKKIKTTYFVKPREALQIVARESFGIAWQSNAIDDATGRLRQIALATLRSALESGKVRAVCDEIDRTSWLDPRAVADNFFRINLEKNCIHLADGAPLQCRIHSEDLERFIRTEVEQETPIVQAETLCRDWLVERRKGPTPIPTKAVLYAEAMEEFQGLSKSGFKRACEGAAKALGLSQFRPAGSPRTVKI